MNTLIALGVIQIAASGAIVGLLRQIRDKL